MLYHTGDSRHAQNIQINQVISKNEKCVFYFMEKTIQAFWPTQQFTDTGIKTEARAVGFIEVVQAKRAIYNALRTSVHIKPPSKISN